MANENGGGRDVDTEPAPTDPEGRLGQQIAELELATYRVGEVLSKVQTTLSLLRLAQGTAEHRLNTVQDVAEVHADQLEDHEGRIGRLEAATAPAAE